MIINGIGEFSFENRMTLGPVWGLQRNYKSGIHIDFNTGLSPYIEVDGHKFNFLFTELYLMGTVELGYKF